MNSSELVQAIKKIVLALNWIINETQRDFETDIMNYDFNHNSLPLSNPSKLGGLKRGFH